MSLGEEKEGGKEHENEIRKVEGEGRRKMRRGKENERKKENESRKGEGEGGMRMRRERRRRGAR